MAMHWSPQNFEEASENLDANHIAVVQQHIGGVLRNLIGIAELTGYGLEALDAWFDAQQEALDTPLDDPQDDGEDKLDDDAAEALVDVPEAATDEELPPARMLVCRQCGQSFAKPARGRPPSRCPDCRGLIPPEDGGVS